MARIRLRLIATALFFGVLLLPSYQSAEPSLHNYGVKNRSLGGTLLSRVSSNVPLAQELAYKDIENWVPFIKQSSAIYHIPEITLAAILYEEAVHRKPIDVSTFGPAQLGYGELRAQGLPPKRELLEDPEMAIWVLTRQLNRLRKQTGSLANAITLHNGYEDFLKSVQSREKDQRLQMFLNQKQQTYSLEL